MKVKDNRKSSGTGEKLYQVGNIICDGTANFYMVVSYSGRYAFLNLATNEVVSAYEKSLHNLYESCYDIEDTLVDASLIVR